MQVVFAQPRMSGLVGATVSATVIPAEADIQDILG
jgi:hypothetical protein